MLPEFADMGAAETPLSARFAPGLRDQLGEMGFDADCNCRTGSLEVVERSISSATSWKSGGFCKGRKRLNPLNTSDFPAPSQKIRFCPGAVGFCSSPDILVSGQLGAGGYRQRAVEWWP
jgi:hypothetical protein